MQPFNEITGHRHCNQLARGGHAPLVLSAPMAGESYKNIYTNLSAVLNPELYFLQENFSLPQELLMSVAPLPLDRMRFRKGVQCIHESGNSVQPSYRRAPAAPSVIGNKDQLKSTEHAELSPLDMNTCQTEASTGIYLRNLLERQLKTRQIVSQVI